MGVGTNDMLYSRYSIHLAITSPSWSCGSATMGGRQRLAWAWGRLSGGEGAPGTGKGWGAGDGPDAAADGRLDRVRRGGRRGGDRLAAAPPDGDLARDRGRPRSEE